MKLSIAWIFDHIEADYKNYDIPQLIKRFNLTTAEIEQVEKVSYDTAQYTLVQISESTLGSVRAYSKEWNITIDLPFRNDGFINAFYMLAREDGNWRWARMSDWYSAKDGLLPAFACTASEFAGSWKETFIHNDYILHVDNKSITHRPDLWSHRGFAREIAAILGVSLRDEQSLYATHSIVTEEKKIRQATGNPFAIELQDPEKCKRFALVYIPNIGHYASWMWMTQRLCKVDIRPFDGFVDATNYVMLDIGQPLHAFDAEKIKSTCIKPRLAYLGEKLTLLDGQSIELNEHDMVITDGKQPLALAGIMGGKASAIESSTRSIVVEAANFDAAMIRKTAQKFKLRTDASTRFEKALDQNLTVSGLLRFLKILESENISLSAASDIVSLGKCATPYAIDVPHAIIERSLGVAIPAEFVQKTLTALEFKVEVLQKESHCIYHCIVPTFRSTKDIRLPEDIVEEIGRFYGYGNIPLILPELALKSHSIDDVCNLRKIREFMASSLQARELYNYAFYDETFLSALQWEPKNAAKIVNPVSHNWQRLVTSLIPHLFKSVVHAGTHNEEIRFFEWNRIWKRSDLAIEEKKSLAGIIYHKKEKIDFYSIKDQLDRLSTLLGISVAWKKYDGSAPWYHPYQTATLVCNNTVVGYAGLAQEHYMRTVLEGNAFIFELSGDILTIAKTKQEKFKTLNKYQDSWFDISLLCPVETTVEQITKSIKNVDARIVSVTLKDFFEKEEWHDKRSITMRIIIQDPHKTLIKEEIENVHAKVILSMQKIGAAVR